MAKMTCILMGLLISVCTVPAVTSHPLTSLDSDDGADFKVYEDEINAVIQSTLEKYDPIKLPFFPAISITMEDIDMALTMTDIEISLFSGLRVTSFAPGIITPKVDLSMTLPRLSLTAGQYAAAGQLLNLEFYGEGPMSFDLYDLKVMLRVKRTAILDYCIVPGTSQFWIDLDHWEVNFEGMNPDSDQGQLINIVLSTFGPEIFDYIESLLNGKYHNIVDGFLVKQINKAINNVLGSDLCKV